MATKKTIRKCVCDKCGDVQSKWYSRRKHGYDDSSCGGNYVITDVIKDVLVGEFAFERSHSNHVYLRHIESGRVINIFTIDLLKIMAGRPIGSLRLTESARGDQLCWKADEVSP
jgi:hypothetical protein